MSAAAARLAACGLLPGYALRRLLLPPRRRPWRRVLFVRLDFVGDMVAYLPVLELFHRRYPQTELHVLAELAAWQPLLEAQPHITRVHDAAAVMAAARRGTADWPAVRELLRTLRAERYDAVVLANKHRNVWLNVAAALVGRGEVYGFASRSARLLFRAAPPEDVTLAETARNCALLPLLGVPLPAVLPSPRLQVTARPRPADDMTAVAVHAGSTQPHKRWPAERFAATLAAAGRPLRVTLVGTEADRAANATVRAALPPGIAADDRTGTTTLAELAALLAAHDLLLGNDSGVMHLAAAVGTRAVAVFGPTDAGKWLPPGATAITAPAGDLAALPVEPVAAAVRRVLAEAAR